MAQNRGLQRTFCPNRSGNSRRLCPIFEPKRQIGRSSLVISEISGLETPEGVPKDRDNHGFGKIKFRFWKIIFPLPF